MMVANDEADSLFLLAPDAILIVEAAGTIRRINPQAEQLFGYCEAELIGKPIEVLLPERYHDSHVGARENYVAKPHRRRMGSGLELWARRKDGSEFAVEVALGPNGAAMKEGGVVEQPREVLCIVRDISESHRARQLLEQRVAERTAELSAANQAREQLHQQLLEEHQRLLGIEKLSSLGMLAASVVHEVNNPLSGVRSLARALQHESLPVDKQREYLAAIREGLDRVAETIRGLLDLAREQPLTIVDLDALEVCTAAVRLLAATLRQRGLVVEVTVPAHTIVRADRSRVLQAVLNLVINAAHATPKGGRIEVGHATRPGFVGVRIKDTGSGIPSDIVARVSEPFFTTKPSGQGTGLGLAVVSNTMKAHQGEMQIESATGLGTSVTLWFRA